MNKMIVKALASSLPPWLQGHFQNVLWFCLKHLFPPYLLQNLNIHLLLWHIAFCWFYTWVGEGNGTPLQHSCLEDPVDRGAWWAAVHGVAKSWTRLSDFTFTFHFHALETEMATHSSVLAWRLPGMGEPGGLPSMGSQRVGYDWSDLAAAAAIAHLDEMTWNLLSDSCCPEYLLRLFF